MANPYFFTYNLTHQKVRVLFFPSSIVGNIFFWKNSITKNLFKKIALFEESQLIPAKIKSHVSPLTLESQVLLATSFKKNTVEISSLVSQLSSKKTTNSTNHIQQT